MAERRSANVLVIGGGLAGLQAAEIAAQFVDDIVVVDGSGVSRSEASGRDACTLAAYLGQGVEGLTSPLFNRAHLTFDRVGEEKLRSMRTHFFAYRDEILENGCGLGDPKLAEFVVDGIYNRIAWLESYHLEVVRDREKKYRAFPTPGHTQPRTFVLRQSGEEVMQAVRTSAAHLGVRTQDRIPIIKLFARGSRVTGAFGIDLSKGTPVAFDAKAIILAAGGASRLYRSGGGTSGDGPLLALEAGAELANMEFISFVPEPDFFEEAPTELGSILLGLGCELKNRNGERFMARYDAERKEKSSLATLARAIFEESRAGPVLSSLTKEITQPLRDIGLFEPFLREGEIRWHVGFGGMLGGVAHRVFQSRVDGLFVAGETATGLHGADSLPSVGTSFTLYASENAGSRAASYAAGTEQTATEESQIRLEEKKLDDLVAAREPLVESRIDELEDRLRAAMWKGAGVLRDEAGLKTTLKEIGGIEAETSQKGAERMEGVVRLLQLRNLIATGKLVCQAALARRESRGQHQRSDHPAAENRTWRIMAFLGPKGLEFRESPVSS